MNEGHTQVEELLAGRTFVVSAVLSLGLAAVAIGVLFVRVVVGIPR